MQNGSTERAIEWLFSHDGSDEPAHSSAAEASTSHPSGQASPGDRTLPARYTLKAFVSHKGPSVHSGHYVAHCLSEGDQGWVLFNDEKVVRADYGAQSAEALAP